MVLEAALLVVVTFTLSQIPLPRSAQLLILLGAAALCLPSLCLAARRSPAAGQLVAWNRWSVPRS
ncbi:MAG: hypothetical protein KY475_01940 [Planctomycetes bacterium]|nr:hypothetical protein [Planctomycetota bacterium]